MNQNCYYESRINSNSWNCRQVISPKDWNGIDRDPAGRPWATAVPSGGETRNCVGLGYNLWSRLDQLLYCDQLVSCDCDWLDSGRGLRRQCDNKMFTCLWISLCIFPTVFSYSPLISQEPYFYQGKCVHFMHNFMRQLEEIPVV